MDDINWYCEWLGLNLYLYQKIILKIINGKNIKKYREVIKKYKEMERENGNLC